MARYPATSGWRPSGVPRKRFVSPGSATAAWVSQNRIPRTFVRFSIHALRVRMSPEERAVAMLYGRTVAATGTIPASRMSAYIGEVTLNRLRSVASEDVVHPREDDRVCRMYLEDISWKPRPNFLRGLAVDPPVQDRPFGVRLHHPVCVLALWVPLPARRRLERRAKTGSARGRGIPESDNRHGPLSHRAAIEFRVNMLAPAAPNKLKPGSRPFRTGGGKVLER